MIVDQAQALRELVRESTPSASAEMSAVHRSANPQTHSRQRARIVAVTSGKGGVGKTNIALNLAVKLASMSRRVVLLDADLGTANADVLCNLSPRYTLAHVIAGRVTLDEAMIEGPGVNQGTGQGAGTGGFQLVPGASGLAQVAALREFERTGLIEQMHNLEYEADIILIDTGAGVGPNVLSFASSADQLVVVTSPEPTAITDAYALIKTVHRRRQDIDVRVLVNMVSDDHEARQVYQRIDAVCRRFLRLTTRYAGHVVHDVRVCMAVRQRIPFVIDSPNCEASRCMSKLAHRMDRHAAEPRTDGLLKRMASWLGGS